MGRQSSKDKYKLSAVDSIERLPLSEQVYLTLKTAILTGKLMPQEKLNEVKIAEQLQHLCVRHSANWLKIIS